MLLQRVSKVEFRFGEKDKNASNSAVITEGAVSFED